MDEDLSWIFSNELSDNKIYVYTLDIPQEIEQEEALNIVEVLDVQDLERWEAKLIEKIQHNVALDIHFRQLYLRFEQFWAKSKVLGTSFVFQALRRRSPGPPTSC